MTGETEDSAMNDQTDALDQTDEEILAATAADEALEIAAAAEGAGRYPTNGSYVCC